MISDPIFKKDSKGKIRTWQYEVNGDSWRTIAGLQDGAKVESGWTVCTAKSQDTAEEQALFEAQAEQKKKLARDYHASIEEVATPNFFKPMLAQGYSGAPSFAVKTYAQPKLDGIRCIATANGLYSRQGKQFFNAAHIEEALKPVFAVHPDLILDGELYNHELKDDFNKITSVVRKQKPSADDAEAARKLIQYHVYDLPHPTFTFSERFNTLAELIFNSDALQKVETFLVADAAELDALYARWIEQGYEGQMVRLDRRYEQTRSANLLKRKEFDTNEYPVIRVEEGVGNWAGYAKRIVCQLPDGREFGSGLRGDQSFAKALLTRQVNVATVRHFGLTPDGVPRFPVTIDFDRQE